jgi:hypothetical protein
MNRIRFGIIAGLIFGVLDILPMLAMDLPNQKLAIAGAFINRFSIGFLIPNVKLPTSAWSRGLFLGALLSLPDAIITGATIPILATGLIGGLIIGIILGRTERKSTTPPNPEHHGAA